MQRQKESDLVVLREKRVFRSIFSKEKDDIRQYHSDHFCSQTKNAHPVLACRNCRLYTKCFYYQLLLFPIYSNICSTKSTDTVLLLFFFFPASTAYRDALPCFAFSRPHSEVWPHHERAVSTCLCLQNTRASWPMCIQSNVECCPSKSSL